MPKKVEFIAPNRIREWRSLRGLTLKQLAERLNLTYAEVSRYERGDRQVSVDLLKRFAVALTDPEDGIRLTAADMLNPEDGGLERAERRLIDTVREVPEAGRRAIYSVMDSQQPYRGEPEVLPLRANDTGQNAKR